MGLSLAAAVDTFYLHLQFFEIKIHKYKYTNTNTQIQIHKYKYTNTNTQIQHILAGAAGTGQLRPKKSHAEYFSNTNTQIQIHKYTNTNSQIQIHKYSIYLLVQPV